MTERSELIMPSRRGFLGGLLALAAAPAIVRASSLMPISVMPDEEVLQQLASRNNLLTIDMITREAVRLWKNSNEFLENLDAQYDDAFNGLNATVGKVLRVRLPTSLSVLSPV